MQQQRLELQRALGECRLGVLRPGLLRQQPEPVFGVCEMIPERNTGRAGLQLRTEGLDQVRQLIGIFDLEGVENPRLKVAPLLRVRQQRRGAQRKNDASEPQQ